MSSEADRGSWWADLPLVILLGLAVTAAFLQAPGVGDDLTYWQLAFELHDVGPQAWDPRSFHDLRWPVWGPSWLLQAVFGPGLLSYYGVPAFYMVLGALACFVIGRSHLHSRPVAWIAAIAFLFHPLLDTVAYRPMPDLSEAGLGALAMLCWFGLMTSGRVLWRLPLAAATGLLLMLLAANRITGVFMIPVMLACTVGFFPRRLPWLVLAGAFALCFVAIEAAIYQRLAGDFLLSLHSNLGARGRKGTESVALWYLPLRFLDSLWKGNVLSPVYVLLCLGGCVPAWREFGRAGRACIVWLAVIYLAYSCAVQGFDPPRPLVRDADRFLSGLVPAMALVVAVGARWVWLFVQGANFTAGQRLTGWMARHPGASVCIAVLAAGLLTSRSWFDAGYVPAIRRYVAAVAPGTTVFTHDGMRALIHLVDGRRAQELIWVNKRSIYERDEKLERGVAGAGEFWFSRKVVWLNERKRLERGDVESSTPRGSYLDNLDYQWRLAEVVQRDEKPDYVFFKRRAPGEVRPRVIEASDLGFSLPIDWKRPEGQKKTITNVLTVPVPPDLRGRAVRLEMSGFSNDVEAAKVTVQFRAADSNTLAACFLDPYFHPVDEPDFFAFTIPAAAESAEVTVDFPKGTRALTLRRLRLIVEEPRQGP